MSLPYGDGEPREGGGETRTIYMCRQTGYYSLLVHTLLPAMDISHTQMRPLNCFLRNSIPCLDQMCVHMHGFVLTIEKYI